MRLFVDTSALFALLAEDDRRHESAASALRHYVTDGSELVTHSYVLVESVALTDRRLGRHAARRLLADLVPALDTIWITEELHRSAVAAFISSARRVSLVDTVSFEVMRRHGIETAFAFDPDFVAAGYRTVPQHAP